MDDDGEEAGTSDDCLTSLQWFLEVYPALPPEKRPIELVQNPGGAAKEWSGAGRYGLEGLGTERGPGELGPARVCVWFRGCISSW